MKIEDEIQQKQFTNEQHKVAVNILYTAAWLQSANQRVMRPLGISPEQFNVLRILRGQYPEAVSVRSIALRMIDKSSNASRLVDKLVVKGLADRNVSSADRRQVDVSITPEGLDLLAKLDVVMQEMNGKFDALSPAEVGMLNGLLDKLRGGVVNEKVKSEK